MTEIEVHQNTVHTSVVICAALYAVVHHRAPPENLECELDGSIPIIPPRTAAKLVLDISGSMLLPAGSTGDTKLRVLQDAVILFADLWSAVTAESSTRLGVTYFGTTTSSFPIGGKELFPVTLANLGLLQADVLGQTTITTNMTAMGAGLLDGLQALGAQYDQWIPSRHVVLFTDGMQNVQPLVTNPPPVISGTLLDGSLGVRIHTIEVGGQSAVMQLLAGIASSTNGTSRGTHDPAGQLNQIFVEELVDVLKDNSPQLIDYRRGALAENAAEERFRVNRGVRRLVLKLSWVRGKTLNLTVHRGGQDMTRLGRIRVGPFYRLYIIDSPDAGVWSMMIRGDGEIAYEVAAIVDEPRLRFDLQLARPHVRAGEPLEITLKLGRADASRVVATVAAPVESIENILSKNPTPREPPGFQFQDGNPVDKKLQLLLMDEALRRTLQPVEQVMPLNNNGDGTWSLSYRRATVPGAWRITVSFEVGDYHRRATTSALVRIGTIERDASGLSIEGRVLTIRPQDRFGNYLGPGNGHLIDVEPALGPPVDQLDGRYTIALGPDRSRVRIRVDGDVVFDDQESELDPDSFPWVLVFLTLLFVLLIALLLVFLRRR